MTYIYIHLHTRCYKFIQWHNYKFSLNFFSTKTLPENRSSAHTHTQTCICKVLIYIEQKIKAIPILDFDSHYKLTMFIRTWFFEGFPLQLRANASQFRILNEYVYVWIRTWWPIGVSLATVLLFCLALDVLFVYLFLSCVDWALLSLRKLSQYCFLRLIFKTKMSFTSKRRLLCSPYFCDEIHWLMHILSHRGATTEDNSMAHTVRLRFWAFSKYKLIYLHLFSFACFFFFFLKCIFIVTAASVYGFMKLIINRFSFVFSVLLSFLSKKIRYRRISEEICGESCCNAIAESTVWKRHCVSGESRNLGRKGRLSHI